MLSTIEIDFDIHRMIENERRGFDEPPRAALRRLLKLPDENASPNPKLTTSEGRSWREGNVEIPHGSKARMAYQRGSQVFEGQFIDGKLIVNGREFHTLSSAASALARTRDGSVPSLNGWNYWEICLPGQDRWIPANVLRRPIKKARF